MLTDMQCVDKFAGESGVDVIAWMEDNPFIVNVSDFERHRYIDLRDDQI